MNTLFTDVFQYNSEKLVNAVLKTLWIYLPTILIEDIKNLAGNCLKHL